MATRTQRRRQLAGRIYVGVMAAMLAGNVYAFFHLQRAAAGDRRDFPRDRNRQYVLERREEGRRLSATLRVAPAGVMNAKVMRGLEIDYAIQEGLLGHEVHAPSGADLHPESWRWRSLVPLHRVEGRPALSPEESWKRRSASQHRLLVGNVTIHLPFVPGEGPGGDLHLYADHRDPDTLYVLTPEEHARLAGSSP